MSGEHALLAVDREQQLPQEGATGPAAHSIVILNVPRMLPAASAALWGAVRSLT